MTHDELLTEINRRLEVALYNGDPQSLQALRAVVELHKPKDFMVETDFPWVGCWECEELYPCLTIQAIEKELQ